MTHLGTNKLSASLPSNSHSMMGVDALDRSAGTGWVKVWVRPKGTDETGAWTDFSD